MNEKEQARIERLERAVCVLAGQLEPHKLTEKNLQTLKAFYDGLTIKYMVPLWYSIWDTPVRGASEDDDGGSSNTSSPATVEASKDEPDFQDRMAGRTAAEGRAEYERYLKGSNG